MESRYMKLFSGKLSHKVWCSTLKCIWCFGENKFFGELSLVERPLCISLFPPPETFVLLFGEQVQNFHSCIQVTEDFVSPEHLVQSFHLTQELRLLKEEINYDDKLQVRDEFSNCFLFCRLFMFRIMKHA